MSQIIEKTAWRRAWLNLIREMSDLEVQQERWSCDRDLPNASSYAELKYMYLEHLELSNYGLGYRGKIEDETLTANEVEVVFDMDRAFKNYHDSPNRPGYDDNAILSDPNWMEVIEMAQKARTNLLSILTDSAEISVLKGKSDLEQTIRYVSREEVIKLDKEISEHYASVLKRLADS